MRFDLQIPESWSRLNDVYRQALDIPPESLLSAQIYLGCQHAVMEICLSLAQMIPHRKTIAYYKAAGPEFEAVAVAFAREGYNVKALTRAEMENPKEWVEAGLRDLLCILNSFDDPVTGEIHDFPALDELTKDKKIYRISLSHARHRCETLPLPPPYGIQIRSLEPRLALAILGERGKTSPAIASLLDWETTSIEAARTRLGGAFEATKTADWKARVLKLEGSLPEGATVYFKPDQARVYDRAVFYFRDLDGVSFLEALAGPRKFALGATGRDADWETASLCRWTNARTFAWLSEAGVAPEVLRGLIVIAAETIDDTLASHLKAARAQVLRDQLG